MELERHVDSLREQLAVAAEAGGDDARALAQRLTAPLDASVRLMLLDVLADAAAEITAELAPGSVEVRLRGGDPEFVVAAPPPDQVETAESGAEEVVDVGDGGVARINLRLPERLKDQVDQAADREGLSINAWLLRAAAAAVERRRAGSRRDRGAPRGGQRYTGWGR
jgi:hypothetical protein